MPEARGTKLGAVHIHSRPGLLVTGRGGERIVLEHCTRGNRRGRENNRGSQTTPRATRWAGGSGGGGDKLTRYFGYSDAGKEYG